MKTALQLFLITALVIPFGFGGALAKADMITQFHNGLLPDRVTVVARLYDSENGSGGGSRPKENGGNPRITG